MWWAELASGGYRNRGHLKLQGRWTVELSNAERRAVVTGLDFRWKMARLQQNCLGRRSSELGRRLQKQ